VKFLHSKYDCQSLFLDFGVVSFCWSKESLRKGDGMFLAAIETVREDSYYAIG